MRVGFIIWVVGIKKNGGVLYLLGMWVAHLQFALWPGVMLLGALCLLLRSAQALSYETLVAEQETKKAELQAEAKVITPVADFARRVAGTHPVAIASGGPGPVVRRSLELAGLDVLFKVVVTADDVVHGKPSPDMFLLAAELMGVPPAECLVFEDAEPGMRAAEAAGMKWVRVPSRGASPRRRRPS